MHLQPKLYCECLPDLKWWQGEKDRVSFVAYHDILILIIIRSSSVVNTPVSVDDSSVVEHTLPGLGIKYHPPLPRVS